MASAEETRASTEASITPALHDIQLRYSISTATVRTLSTANVKTRQEVLQTVCNAAEFRTFPIKQQERAFFRSISEHSAIPYPVAGTVSQPWHKAFLLIQIDMQGEGWPNKLSAKARQELLQEGGKIYTLTDRVLRCLIDTLGHRGDGRGLRIALDVLRSVKARTREGGGKELLQIPGIGQAKMKKLVDAGISNVKQLARLEFYHIERLLSRNPPFGQQMKHQLANFPVLALRFDIIGRYGPPSTSEGVVPEATNADLVQSMWIARLVLGFQNEKVPAWGATSTPWTTLVVEGQDGRLVWFWRGSVKRLTPDKEMFVALDLREGEELKVAFACEEIVGTPVQVAHVVRQA
ncbi:meiotic helicase [Stachybotrys elegans]|uniref:Meiotic helicase n=1 Tax=Stachybotrys elegans TaxID=80388 RepID=A0A8K0SMV9_9HYPO|nr:meiotic helicase [Stachybotrys elegans]